MDFETIIGKDISAAKHWLEAGEVIGIPTETVYGLGGNALSEDAVLKIFAVKNRPHFDPLIVHTHSVAEIRRYAKNIPAVAEKLIAQFMPGPLTVLLPKADLIPELVTSGLDTVGIRIPNHPLTLSLLKQLAFPLAAPSANPFGYISPTTAQHVMDQLKGKIPYILDGGPTVVGVESTIISFEGEVPVVHRLGGLALEEIERVVGKVQMNLNSSSNPQAPGMLKSHYAPNKELLFGPIGSIVHFAAGELKGKKIGVIAFDKYIEGFDEKYQVLLSTQGDLREAAKNLFATMRSMDNSDVDVIYAIEFPNQGLGLAINDRLKRAAS